MISRCHCTAAAARTLREMTGVHGVGYEKSAIAELEFREVPYCIVSRRAEQWGESKGDINTLLILIVTDHGVVVDPDSSSESAENAQPARRTLIPWTNIVSLTLA